MLSYKDFTRHFGLSLFDKDFQTFLTNLFSDLTEYDILGNSYVSSKKDGIDIGFTNNEAIYDDENVVFTNGNPLFSHLIFYPKSVTLINYLPFDSNFKDHRIEIIKKAGEPLQTKEGFAEFLNKSFLVDNYKTDNLIITFDYDIEKQTINFVQIRDNNLVEHLKL